MYILRHGWTFFLNWCILAFKTCVCLKALSKSQNYIKIKTVKIKSQLYVQQRMNRLYAMFGKYDPMIYQTGAHLFKKYHVYL